MVNQSQPFWNFTTIPLHHCMRAQVGLLRIWISHIAEQTWQAHTEVQQTLASEPLQDAAPPDHAARIRFAVPSQETQIQLMPTLPDMAVVIRSSVPMEILPRGTAQIYISIPCWLQLKLGEKGWQMLHEYETETLSKTWFGADTKSGEICYSLCTLARRTLEETTDTDGRIIVPITISNSSDEKLSFTRFCIRPSHMSVYGTPDGTLWTNRATFNHYAGKKAVELKLDDAAPTEAEHAALLSPPRSPPKTHSLRDLFSFL